MKDEHLKLLTSLIKYADGDTLRLIDNFPYSNGLINLCDFDISYKFLCLAVNNNSDIKYQKLEKFLELLLKISTNLSYKTYKKYAKQLERIIKLVFEVKKILYWEIHGDKVVIHYCKLSDVFSKEFKKISLKLKRNNNLICLNNTKRLQMLQALKIDKFLSTYKFLASELDKSNKNYCPWCNPNKSLEHTPRQRKCDKCKDIEDFLLRNYSGKELDKMKKNLNMQITRINGANLEATVVERGKFLMNKIDEMLSNVNNKTQEITHIKKSLKVQYNLKN